MLGSDPDLLRSVVQEKLGDCHSALGDQDSAQSAYREVLAYLEAYAKDVSGLGAVEAERRQYDLASALEKTGKMQYELGQRESACVSLSRAATIVEGDVAYSA